MKQIKWSSKLVMVSRVKPTPMNYKIKTALGKERLAMSMKLFGLAGNVVLNTDYTLIDGNSRLEEALEKGEKKIWASFPNRRLTPKEFKEMSAMFDVAKAGDIDMDSIMADLGDKKDFLNKWGMTVPMHLLDKVGKGAKISDDAVKAMQYPTDGKDQLVAGEDTVMVNLFFKAKQEVQFRKMEEVFMEKFKTKNTTDTVLRVFDSLFKGSKTKPKKKKK